MDEPLSINDECAALHEEQRSAECMICMEEGAKLLDLPNCQHKLCAECLPKVAECPYCRSPVGQEGGAALVGETEHGQTEKCAIVKNLVVVCFGATLMLCVVSVRHRV